MGNPQRVEFRPSAKADASGSLTKQRKEILSMWFFCLPSLVAILVIGFIQVQDELSRHPETEATESEEAAIQVLIEVEKMREGGCRPRSGVGGAISGYMEFDVFKNCHPEQSLSQSHRERNAAEEPAVGS